MESLAPPLTAVLEKTTEKIVAIQCKKKTKEMLGISPKIQKRIII
jgi:hypothetical protein